MAENIKEFLVLDILKSPACSPETCCAAHKYLSEGRGDCEQI